MPITIGYDLPAWLRPALQYGQSMSVRRQEREIQRAQAEAEQDEAIKMGAVIGGTVLTAGIGALAAAPAAAAVGGGAGLGAAATTTGAAAAGGGSVLGGLASGAALGSGIGQAVGGALTGDLPFAAQGISSTVGQLGRIADQRSVAEIAQTIASDRSTPQEVTDAVGRLANVDPNAALSLATGINRDRIAARRADERQDRIDQRAAFGSLQYAQNLWDREYYDLLRDVGGDRAVASFLIGRPRPTYESINLGFRANESVYEFPAVQQNFREGGAEFVPNANDPVAMTQLKALDQKLQESKTALLQGRITEDQYASELAQFRQHAALVKPELRAKPIQVPQEKQFEEQTLQYPAFPGYVFKKRTMKDGSTDIQVLIDPTEAEAKKAKAELDNMLKRVKLKKDIIEYATNAKNPLMDPNIPAPTPQELSQYARHLVPDEMASQLGYPPLPPRPGTPEAQQVAAQQQAVATQAAIQQSAAQAEYTRIQTENAFRELNLLMRELGDDPKKWGAEQASGLRQAMIVVMGGGEIPPKVAEEVLNHILDEFSGVPTPQQQDLVSRLMAMAEAG